MAGESADEVARRSRDKAERLLRHAEKYEKGAAGERAVQALLRGLPDEWTVFHDVHWPGRARANIDHVVVGPGGVFVIDSKNWTGSVTVRDGVLRQNGYSRATTIHNAQDATVAIASLVPSLPREGFISVVCFAGDAGLDAVLDGVLACRASSLLALLMSRPRRLSADWLDYLRYELDMSTRAATAPVQRFPASPPRRTPAPAPTVGRPRPAATTTRRWGSLPIRRFLLGLLIWLLTCTAVFYTVGVTTRSEGLLVAFYLGLIGFAALCSRRLIRQ